MRFKAFQPMPMQRFHSGAEPGRLCGGEGKRVLRQFVGDAQMGEHTFHTQPFQVAERCKGRAVLHVRTQPVHSGVQREVYAQPLFLRVERLRVRRVHSGLRQPPPPQRRRLPRVCVAQYENASAHHVFSAAASLPPGWLRQSRARRSGTESAPRARPRARMRLP